MRHLRPRPIDIHKKLAIIRSEEDVGGNKGASQNFMELDAKNKPILSATTRLGGGTEINTPSFRVVESYEKEYKPIFTQPSSYIRSPAEKNVEYDLDDEDDDWLKQINIPSRVLDPFTFESMLYKLEVLDRRSREQTGGMPTKRTVGMPVLLQHDDALGALQVHTNSLSTCDAVYEYWKSKRDHWRKPILRRLQPFPTKVVTPVEKGHRQHTRQSSAAVISSSKKLREQRSQNLEQPRNLLLARCEPLPPEYESDMSVDSACDMEQKTEEKSLDQSTNLRLDNLRDHLPPEDQDDMSRETREGKKSEQLELEATLQRVGITIENDSLVDNDEQMATNSSLSTSSKFSQSNLREHGHRGGVQGPSIGDPDHINKVVGPRLHPSELSMQAAEVALGDQTDIMSNKRKREKEEIDPQLRI